MTLWLIQAKDWTVCSIGLYVIDYRTEGRFPTLYCRLDQVMVERFKEIQKNIAKRVFLQLGGPRCIPCDHNLPDSELETSACHPSPRESWISLPSDKGIKAPHKIVLIKATFDHFMLYSILSFDLFMFLQNQ